jgi:PadR family transcriptional regulator PadR
MTRRPHTSHQTRTLLQALLEAPATWRHGYDLTQQTGLKSGTLYPILMRLADQGLLESKWIEAEQPGRPPRHAYRLSQGGLVLAREVAKVGSPLRRLRTAGATT